MWVPLVENNEFNSPGADYFVKKHIDHILSVDPQIDTLILGCTHYPLLMDKIRAFLPSGITLFSQGEHVAESLRDYLGRHPEMDVNSRREEVAVFLPRSRQRSFLRRPLSS